VARLRETHTRAELIDWCAAIAEICTGDPEGGDLQMMEAVEAQLRADGERMEEHDRRMAEIESRFRVRTRNTALLGLGKVETVGLDRSATR